MTIFQLARLRRTHAIALYLQAHGLNGSTGTQGKTAPNFTAMSRERLAAAIAEHART